MARSTARLFGVALDELVLAGAALLDQLAVLAGDVEDRLQLPVAAGLLVVRVVYDKTVSDEVVVVALATDRS